MSLEVRFGELRSVMHAMRGEDRWQAVCAMLQDWPDADHRRETIIPYLQGLFARDESIRLAPDAWWAWGPADELVNAIGDAGALASSPYLSEVIRQQWRRTS